MIGKKLVELREERGYTQNEVAKLTQMPQSLLWKYERDECVPSVINALKLAKLFGVAIEELLEENAKGA